MKTRIISGVVMGVIVAVILAAGYFWNSLVVFAAVAILAAVAAYELLHNAAGINDKLSLIGACAYTVFATYTFRSIFYYYLFITVLYFLFAVVMVLKNNKAFSLAHIVSLCAMPPIIGFAFSALDSTIITSFYYFLLLFNFSSVCDMGAYFTGSFLGKHKLCPNVSPKKTVEGAVGGVLSSIVVTVIIALCFKKSLLAPIILTVPFCIIGMLGDLFASSIKRSVGLKDYGNLIPGHGGILDRVDSIIMIVPLLYLLILYGVI